MNKIAYSDLVSFVSSILKKCGLAPYSLDAVTTGLCETSLRGVDSHGVRLLPHYVNSALHGRKNPKPDFLFNRTLPSFGHLDGDNAFGHAAGMKAIDHGMELAEETGVGAVGVSNSSHPGAMASFALKAARKGYIAFAFTHADSLILSHNGKRPYFGTNPVCMAAPREEEDPYCLDMATSVIPWNRLLLYKSKGTKIPPDVAADGEGNMTTDPEKATCLMPVGSYKGYCLASMVEVLCACLTGMAFGRHIPSMYGTPIEKPRRLGQFYMVMRTDGCIPAESFKTMLQQMTDEVRKEPAVKGEQVMLPGDKEMYEAQKRIKDGIPLDPATLDSFVSLSKEHSVPLELIA